MRLLCLLFISLLCLSQKAIKAQEGDTLKGAVVMAEQGRVEPKFEMVDSLSTASDRWIFMAPINFHSGGLNDYAGIAVRGASMSQTLVTWNGLSLNSALSGIADVSMLKSGMMESAELITQGDGVRYGSQAVGGILQLENNWKNDSIPWEGSCRMGMASFGNYSGLLSLHHKSEKLWVGFKLNLGKGKNNYQFPYKENRFWLNPENLNGNNEYLGQMLSIALPGEKSRHELYIWNQYRQRELSPLVTNPSDSSYIVEKFIRMVNKNSFFFKKDIWKIDLGYSHDALDYNHPGYNIHSKNRFKLAQLDQKYQHQDWEFSWFSQYAWAPEDLSHHYLYNKFGVDKDWYWASKWQLSTGLAWVQFHEQNKPQYSIQLAYEINNNNRVYADFNSVFRNPNLNELYFDPGGNPDIQAEEGWATSVNYAGGSEKFQTRMSIYHREIQNWIFWYGALVFSPYNLAEVHSTGLEAMANLRWFNRSNIKSRIGLNTNIVQSLLKENNDPKFEAVVGNQLPYTPSVVLNLNLNTEYKNWSLVFLNHFQSSRFATLDPTWKLESFLKSDLSLAYTWDWSAQPKKLRVEASCRNLWNSYYEYIFNRPLPGRNYALDLEFVF